MIVHPIGMMRANAASGLNFVDDFSSYTVGQTLVSQNPSNYFDGGGSVIAIIADSGGTKVLRQPGGQSYTDFIGGTAASDREVSVTLKSVGQSNYTFVYLSFIDANNFTGMFIYPTGWVGVQQKAAGANVFNQNLEGSFSTGDKFTLSRVGTAVIFKRNGVQQGATFTATAAASGSVRLHMTDVASPSSFWEISQFEVKDL